MKSIPCQIIAGPLGIGKTTTLLAYLKRQQGRERIAILVNDFGTLGIDGTLLNANPGSPESPRIVSVPGGCLCCTASIYFEQGLHALAEREDIDRIFIEPSGIVLLTQLKEELHRIMARLPLTLGPTITLLSPVRVREAHYKALPFFTQLVDEADYLVANYADRATPEAIAHFQEWTGRLVPPKRGIYVTSHGVLPDALFESDESSTAPASTHPAHTAHHSQLQRGAWEAPPDAIMDPASLIDWLEKAAAAENHFGLLRLKGMIFTARGWMEIQWTEEGFDTRPFAPQNIQRLEWIMQADGDVDHVTGLLARQGNVLSAGGVGMYRRNSEC